MASLHSHSRASMASHLLRSASASLSSSRPQLFLTPHRPLSSSSSPFQCRILSRLRARACKAPDSTAQVSPTEFREHECRQLSDQQQPATSSDGRISNAVLLSVSPLPLLALAALPGAGAVTALFDPFVELVKTWDLPDWLIHWGHPGNMAVVLFAMGGYGSYLGLQIRLSNDVVVKTNAKDLHPKLMAGMFFFFALGATGGITSLLTSGKPIFESPHAVTGLTGLALLTAQATLTAFFKSNPASRTVHGFLGSGIMFLFLIHAAFGLQLGLSY